MVGDSLVGGYMISEQEIQSLRANQRFIIRELLTRGVSVSLLDWNNELLEASFGDHYEILFDIDSSVVPYTASVVAGSKSITKRLLTRANLSVPQGNYFKSEAVQAILAGAEELGFPVVIKPSLGFQGRGVHTGLESTDEVRSALNSIVEERGSCEVLVEKHFEAREYRVFITRDKQYAALHRDPAYVIGDGRSSIKRLAWVESFKRMNPRKNSLGAIMLDDEARRYLGKNGRTFNTIPARGEKVYVRGSSNVMMGGVPHDVTDLIHPSLVDICFSALKTIPALPYAGIDVLCLDISKPQTASNYRILEINSAPGIGIHMAPGFGTPRNVAGMVVDCIFPEIRQEKLVKEVA